MAIELGQKRTFTKGEKPAIQGLIVQAVGITGGGPRAGLQDLIWIKN